MTPNDEGLLTDVATAIGTTLGRVAHTTNELIDTAKEKVSGRPARQVKKAALSVRARAPRKTITAKKASRRMSTGAKRARKAASAKIRGIARKTRRTLR